jgi:hypothetical protein
LSGPPEINGKEDRGRKIKEMRMDIGTLPRTPLLGKLLCVAFTLAALCTATVAEDGHRHRGSAQAELHIRVIVVPAVVPPHHKDHNGEHDRDEAAVTYSLSPSAAERLSISQEMRTMLLDSGKHEQVQLTTLVIE